MTPDRPVSPREKAFNLPPVILIAIGLLLAIQALRSVVSDELDAEILLRGSFIPAPWSVIAGWTTPEALVAAAGLGGDGAGEVRQNLATYVLDQGLQPWSLLTYSFLHGSWTHVGMNAVWLAAFGTSVVGRAGPGRTLALALVTALGGAAAQWLADPLGVQPVVGASAVLSGFMAAASTFIFEPRYGFGPPRSRWAFLGNRGALGFLGAWFAANLLFAVIAVPLGVSDGAIAWQAHIGGLLAGLLVFPFLDPGHARRAA